jgi:hypothetical protein
METYVPEFKNGDLMRDYLETSAKAGGYLIYYNRLHKVINTEQGLRIAVCGEGEG